LDDSRSRPERYAEAEVPTEYGVVRAVVYRMTRAPVGTAASVAAAGAPATTVDDAGAVEHVALVVGDVGSRVAGDPPVLVRVHSECWTGEVMRSMKCDCREQLDLAMRQVTEAQRGVIVYLRQEGRGIGLGNKVRAYALQQSGVDTVEANRLLGFAEDGRRYEVAGAILRDLGVKRVALLTNNPKKVQGLMDDGIDVVKRMAIKAQPNLHNAEYLAVKARKMGHSL
jgi:GTP cyclohydrolase II